VPPLPAALAQTAAAPPGGALAVPLLYVLAGLYIVFATVLLVAGALPESLAANDGAGSRRCLDALGAERQFWQTHAANDVLAGSWAFAAFMVACLLFGLVDLAAEPSKLTADFAWSQLPFAVGAVLLALVSYPDAINRASIWGRATADEEGSIITDELLTRGLVDTSALL
jgi:hypothetical protein